MVFQIRIAFFLIVKRLFAPVTVMQQIIGFSDRFIADVNIIDRGYLARNGLDQYVLR